MKRFFVHSDSRGTEIRDRERGATLVVYGYFEGESDDAPESYCKEIAAHLNRMTRTPFRWPWQRPHTAGGES